MKRRKTTAIRLDQQEQCQLEQVASKLKSTNHYAAKYSILAGFKAVLESADVREAPKKPEKPRAPRDRSVEQRERRAWKWLNVFLKELPLTLARPPERLQRKRIQAAKRLDMLPESETKSALIEAANKLIRASQRKPATVAP